jgi:hypothetical protein
MTFMASSESHKTLQRMKAAALARGYSFEVDLDGTERMLRPDGSLATIARRDARERHAQWDPDAYAKSDLCDTGPWQFHNWGLQNGRQCQYCLLLNPSWDSGGETEMVEKTLPAIPTEVEDILSIRSTCIEIRNKALITEDLEAALLFSHIIVWLSWAAAAMGLRLPPEASEQP